jgi:hypothetical protein
VVESLPPKRKRAVEERLKLRSPNRRYKVLGQAREKYDPQGELNVCNFCGESSAPFRRKGGVALCIAPPYDYPITLITLCRPGEKGSREFSLYLWLE